MKSLEGLRSLVFINEVTNLFSIYYSWIGWFSPSLGIPSLVLRTQGCYPERKGRLCNDPKVGKGLKPGVLLMRGHSNTRDPGVRLLCAIVVSTRWLLLF